MSFVALDIGTSFIKGAILDTRARAVRHVRRVPFPAPVAGLPPAHVEIDPRAVTAAVEQLMGELAPLADACQGVLLCGQMGGIILIDAEGLPRTNYISWRDQRVLEPCTAGGTNAAGRTTWLDRVAGLISPNRLAELGNELRPGSCTALLHWLAHCRPDVTSRAIPVSLPAFVAGHLTGKIPAEDPTIAIGGLDVRTGQWHRQALAALGIDGFEWPVVDAHRAAIGRVHVGGAQVPCFPAVGDHQCALLGVGLEVDELSINVSTGSQVSRLAQQSRPGPYQERHYFDGCLVQTITHLPAGRSLDALVALLTELPRAQGLTCPDPWSYIAEKAV
ncbi:MAG TPA: FGGY family carbohydrate kinase, partial [Pirellulales bacterium]